MNIQWINFPECPSADSMLQSSSAMTAHPKQVRIHLLWFSPSLLHGLFFLLVQILLEHWWWVGLVAREQGEEFVNSRRGCECSEHMGKPQPMVKWRQEQRTASPGHRKENKTALPLLSVLFPFALTTPPHLHWREGLGSWPPNVKYSYRTPSITVLGKHQ